jgi:hypothetical protein
MNKLIVIATLLSVMLSGCMATSINEGGDEMQAESTKSSEWSATTVDAAATAIIASLSAEDKEKIKHTEKKDLIQFHISWGAGIRNEYGLFKDNDQLREDACGKGCHPDEASMVIIEKVWELLQ